MGTISSGTGLISGLDIESLVESLMAIERKPVNLLTNQIAELDAERTAYTTIAAKLLSLKMAVIPFRSSVTFRTNSATSSDTNVLTASASSSASPGSYTFRVRQTVQSHQLISQGFNDPSRTAVGTGTITIEVGNGRLDRDTELSTLNEQQGVRRGTIRITDRSGASAEIDLTGTITVADVLDKINSASGIDVSAAVGDDGIVITDHTGQTVSNLTVEDVSGGFAAADLGLVASVASDTLTGNDLVAISEQTALSMLNDGNGIRIDGTMADMNVTLQDGTSFDVYLSGRLDWDSHLTVLNGGQGVRSGSIKITDSAGVESIIDLSAAETLQDVKDLIESQASVTVTFVSTGETKLIVTDTSGGEGTLKIENVGGSFTASDLGIAGESDGGSDTESIAGEVIYSVTTLGDVIRAIEDAADRSDAGAGCLTVQISADGKRLELVDNTAGGGSLTVTSINDSLSAEDLGLAGSSATGTLTGARIIGGLNTVLLKSLNGGSGVTTGSITIQDRTGATATLDLSNAETLSEVLNAINASTDVNVRAELNSAGTGIIVRDLTGSTIATFQISGTLADDLGIFVSDNVTYVDSENNQLQYISRNTLLSDLNAGEGVSTGTLTITDSSGASGSISLTNVDEMTVGDVIDRINALAIGVVASINSTGDGILLTDTAGGAGTLTVGNTATARDLRLSGSASQSGAGTIDGSYEYRIAVGGADTLETIVSRITELDGPFSVSIINDGSEVNAYRLNINSRIGGRHGRIVFNAGQTDLAMVDLAKARDAVITVGGTETSAPIVVSSSSNTFRGLVNGLTVNAISASDTPVTVTVSQDVDSVVAKMQDFVDGVNEILEMIDDYTSYDPETEKAGVLLGSLTVDLVRTRLYRGIRTALSGVGEVENLRDVGITIGSGAKLEFDEQKFREVYAANADDIEAFFSAKDEGFGYVMDDVLDAMTQADNGMLTRTTDGYDQRKELLNDHIEQLEKRLASKEERLYQQFYNMELALARLQSMQTALLSLSNDSSSG